MTPALHTEGLARCHISGGHTGSMAVIPVLRKLQVRFVRTIRPCGYRISSLYPRSCKATSGQHDNYSCTYNLVH
jgi:hypothetical protein